MTFVPRKIKRYGWRPDTPDLRDHIFKPELDQLSVPGSVDLTPEMPPIYDQMQLGSCTGNGWARIMEYMGIKDGVAGTVTPSRLFIYYYERVLEGTPGSDSGAEIRDGAKVVATQGAPPETLWPYSDQDPGPYQQEPSTEAQTAAKKFEALDYQRVQVGGPGAPMRSAIAQGFPIVLGFMVPDYFEQGWDPTTVPLPVPTASANIIGGHCVVLSGYDFTMQRFKVPVFKADNSWGASWGESGRFYFDYRWFTSSETNAGDMWIVKKVS